MEYRTADGLTNDDLLAREAEAFEGGTRPEGWSHPESHHVSVALPAWAIAEAARTNVSRSAVLSMRLAERAEQSSRQRRKPTLT